MNAFDEQLRSAFDGYEPNVTPDFASFEAAMEHASSAGQSDLSRRYRVARRVAAASTAVALGLFGWLMVRDEEPAAEFVAGPAVEQRGEGGWEKFEGGATANLRGAAEAVSNSNTPEHAARTSSSLVIADPTDAAATPVVESAEKNAATDRANATARVHAASVGEEIAAVAADREASTPDPITEEEAVGALLGFESSVQEACEGTEVSFKLDGNWAEGSFLWNFGDGAFSSESEPSHVFNRPGTYDITISVRSHNDGQIRTRTVENMIVVRPRPTADLDWELPKAVGDKTVAVQLVNETERSSSSTWLLGEEKLNQAKAELKVPGEYPVHLIASNAYGCQDHASATLRLGNRLGAGAPSSFSPDGDGRYDTFLPRAAKEAEGAWVFSVFDAEGTEVFTSENALQPWEGELPGDEVASGRRFTWVLKMSDHEGHPMMYTDVVRVE